MTTAQAPIESFIAEALTHVSKGASRNRKGFDLAQQLYWAGYEREDIEAIGPEWVQRATAASKNTSRYELSEFRQSVRQVLKEPRREPRVLRPERTMTIQPIETRYNGWRFRSRLEARWAVCFDTLGLRYDYEPDAFSLSSGVYLPDFRLHVYMRGAKWVWVEVKPEHSEADVERLEELSRLTGGTGLLLAAGSVGNNLDIFGEGGFTVTYPHGVDHGFVFKKCPDCGFVQVEFISNYPCRRCEKNRRYEPLDADCPQIQSAFGAARSARFGAYE